MAHFGKLLLLLGANHVQISRDFQPGYVFGQRKLLNLWNFERHRSHATRDRKRTAHVSISNIERVSHRIRRLLSAEPAQTPRGPFPEVMVKTTFDLLTSFDKDARRRLAMSSSLRGT